MPGIDAFFTELDRTWTAPATGRIPLKLFGSTALMLQTTYERATKDSDVLETADLSANIKQELKRIAGRGSPMHLRHHVYLDVVPSGLPFLPQRSDWHPITAPALDLQHFELFALDIVDVVVSKFARMSGQDLEDVEAMFRLGEVPHERLIARFKAAVDMFAYDARADDLPKFVARLHNVERDVFGVAETEIELPSWI